MIVPHRRNQIKTISLRNADLGHNTETVVLKDITLLMPQGVTAWLRGPSGCGKSTILKTFAGLIEPLNGHYYVNEIEISTLSFEEFIPYRLNIGYSFEIGGLLSNRTLAENIALPLQYHNLSSELNLQNKVEELIKIFGIERYRNERPASVSGGVRKAACVARAFVLNPDILILDEPTAGLNDEGVEALISLLKDKSHSRIALISSRDEAVMKEISDIELSVKHEAKFLGFKDFRKQRKAAV